jgi:RNA polymerase sigma-70 factor (ECF subfamily)
MEETAGERKKQEEYTLAERAKRGDKEAFEQLYARNASVILYQTQELLYAKEDAEDVAQEIILRMYKYIGGLREPCAFKAWMHQIIRTTCWAHNKKKWKRGNIADIDAYSDVIEDTNPDVRPAELAETAEISRAVRRIVGTLPRRQRTALFMYYYNEMTYDEIAVAMGISIKTVGSNITRAKMALKKRMDNMNSAARESDTTETLGGMAFGPAVFAAFEADIAGKVTAAQTEALIRVCGERIGDAVVAGSQHAVAGTMLKSGVGGIKLGVIVAATLSVFITGGIFAGHILSDDDPPESGSPPGAVETQDQTPYRPDASIDLTSPEGLPGQINPFRAKLTVTDGTPIRWRIVDADGTVPVSGTGDEIDEAAFALPPGAYAVEWLVADAAGRTVIVWRDIEIADPASETDIANGDSDPQTLER